jgi:DNA-binding MarR family transcriptional regulator
MLSRIVTNLETAKLVTRTSVGTDARVVQVTSTDAGRALCDEMRNERTEALQFALGKLSAEKRRALLETLPVLEEIVEILRNRDR